MKRVLRIALGAGAMLASACVGDSPTQLTTPEPETALSVGVGGGFTAFSIGDSGHSGLVPGFTWLTPTVKNGQKEFTGTFDPGLAPNIDICPIASDAQPGFAGCSGPVIRTLSGATQPEIITADPVNENYIVNWQSTSRNGIDVGGRYRAIVRVGTRVLGWVDLLAVAKQKDTKLVPDGYQGLLVGSPFLFKWRIETGIPGAIRVTPDPATIKDNETQLFTAVVEDLHGVVLPGVTVDWSIDNSAIAAMSPASAPTDAAGEATSTATPAIGVGGTTVVRATSQGIGGAAVFTVERAVGSVTVTPSDPTILDYQTQVFTATVRDLLNNPLPGASVVWTVDAAAVATLSPTGGVSDALGHTTTTATPAGTPGLTIVRATADGVEGNTTLTVQASCTLASLPDTDGDRLPDCVETNSNVFVSSLDTGTDPNNADTDGDKLNDGDEVLGTLGGLNLPGLGTSPLHRDLLLEYDWFDDNVDPGICGAHSHRPTAAMIARFAAAFTGAPVFNPDGTTGVNVINDYGQGGLYTGGNLVADADGVIAGGVDGSDFQNYKLANFAANRNGYFHYVLLPHAYNTNSSSSGQAEIGGNDLIVSLQCYSGTSNTANTIMHELGHNLGLRHGGFEDQNYKPNYNSIMNYAYQFPGIDNNCTPPGDGVLSYSVGTRPALNENSLDENQGVCGNPPGPAWDWNGNGSNNQVGLAYNLNPSWSSALSVLQDYNDWANLSFAGLGDADGAGKVSALRTSALRVNEIATCDNAPTVAR